MNSPLVFNAFEMASVGYYLQGGWTHPEAERERYTDLSFWQERARLLDEAGFSALFFADVLGVYDTYENSQDAAVEGAVDFPINDPAITIATMLAATKRLNFVLTASTSYEAPFGLARRLSTLDHLSNGRIGWNLVTGYLPNAAQNHGFADQLTHAERYDRAEEFLEVVYKLWEGSWAPGAVVNDKAAKRYADATRVRRIDHEGSSYRVAGPALTEPSPQRTPVIYQAGTSPRGLRFAGTHAEVTFVNGTDLDQLRDQTRRIREAAVEAGRRPDDIKIVTDLSVVLGRDAAQLQARVDQVLAAQSPRAQYAAYSGASGIDLAALADDDHLPAKPSNASQSERQRFVPSGKGPTVGEIKARLTYLSPYAETLVGTPHQVADRITSIAEHTGIDGFNLHELVTPRDFEEFAEQVLPILQERGLFSPAQPGRTYREQLFSAGAELPERHPGAQHRTF